MLIADSTQKSMKKKSCEASIAESKRQRLIHRLVLIIIHCYRNYFTSFTDKMFEKICLKWFY